MATHPAARGAHRVTEGHQHPESPSVGVTTAWGCIHEGMGDPPPTVARSPKLQRASAVCGRPPPPLHSPPIAGHQTRGCGAWHRHRHQPPQWSLLHPGPGSYVALHGVLGAAQGAACCIGCCTVYCWVLHWVLHRVLDAVQCAGCCTGCCAGCWVLHRMLYGVLGAALGAAAGGGVQQVPQPQAGHDLCSPPGARPSPTCALNPIPAPHQPPNSEGPGRAALAPERWEGGTGGTPGPARQGP